MTLTIGTDAYITEAAADSYWSDRGNTDWAALSSTDKEINIRKATDWVDRNYNFVGEKATADQRLKWPRSQAYIQGFLLASTDIPREVEEATAIVADLYRQALYDMEGIVTSASAVKSEKVDVIQVVYDSAYRIFGAAQFDHVETLLRPVVGAGGAWSIDR